MRTIFAKVLKVWGRSPNRVCFFNNRKEVSNVSLSHAVYGSDERDFRPLGGSRLIQPTG